MRTIVATRDMGHRLWVGSKPERFVEGVGRVIRFMTITYGLRYDVYSPPSVNENSPFDYSRRFRTDRNNVAPRLGVAIGSGKTVVRASGGTFTILFRRTCTAVRS